MKNSIKILLREGLNGGQVWFHGTPDVRSLEQEGGFTSRTMSVDYVPDLEQYYQWQDKLKSSRESGDDDAYWKYLDMAPKLKSKFTLRKPIFITNDSSVARTYADTRRAMDYQGAVEKVLKVKVSDGKAVTIVATGDRFRFISLDKVKRGFINAGIGEDEINEIIAKFTFTQRDKTSLKTDVIAVIGEWFKFDYIDVVGVLDSYEGGSRKSTVRMVFDPSHIKIIK